MQPNPFITTSSAYRTYHCQYLSAKDGLSNGDGTYGAKFPASKWSDRYVGAVLVIRAKEVIAIRQAVNTAVGNVLAGSSGGNAAAAC
jgi:hypothetical protein